MYEIFAKEGGGNSVKHDSFSFEDFWKVYKESPEIKALQAKDPKLVQQAFLDLQSDFNLISANKEITTKEFLEILTQD